MADHYCSPSGLDSAAGAIGTPWRSIQVGLSRTNPGDRLILHNGTYSAGEIVYGNNGTTPQGTLAQPITLMALNQGLAIISSTSWMTLQPAISVYGSYLIVDGLRFQVDTSPSQLPSNYSGSNCSVRLWPNNNPSPGSQSSGYVGSIVRNCTIDVCTLASNGFYYRGSGIKDSQDGSLIENNVINDELEIYNCVNAVLRGNVITFGGRQNATMIVCKGGVRDGAIYNNTIHNNFPQAPSILMGGFTGAGLGFDGNQAIEAYNLVCYNNVCINESGTANPHIGFRGAKDCAVVHNVTIGGWGAFATNGGPNNTGTPYGNQGGILKNNIFLAQGFNDFCPFSPGNGAITDMRALAFDYNDTNGFAADVPSQAHPINGNPLFINNASNWHLQATSPCKDAGLALVNALPKWAGGFWSVALDRDGVARPQGIGWDAGAYEITGASTLRTYLPTGGLHAAGNANTLLTGLPRAPKVYVGSGFFSFAGAATTTHPTGQPTTFVQPTPPAPVVIQPNPAKRTIFAPDFASYQAALVAPQFGDEIVLTPGVTYQGSLGLVVPTGQLADITVSPAILLFPVTLTYTSTPIAAPVRVIPTLFVKTFTTSGENFVTIRTSGAIPPAGVRVLPSDAAQMPTLLAPTVQTVPGGYCVFPSVPGVHHYRYVGIHFTSPQSIFNGGIFNLGPDQSMDHTQVATYPHHISVESCYFAADEDFGVNKSIAMQGRHMQVKDTYMTNGYQLGNGDANCIWFDLGPGPYLVDNCLLEGMGENFFCGAESNSGIPITPGFEYVVCGDITVRRSHMRRRYSWKSDDPTYRQPCNVVAPGTMSTVGTALTLTDDQSVPLAYFGIASLAGHYVKRISTNEVRQILSGSGTSFVLTAPFSTNVVAEAFRWNTSILSCKNNFEVKGANRMLVEECIIEKGWGGQGVSFTFTPRRTADISDFHMRWCRWSNTLGMGWGNGDWEQGAGLSASHAPTNRFWMEHCLWEHVGGPRTLPGSNKAFTWNVAGIEWGRFAFQSPSTTMQAGATTGTGIIFTCNTPVWDVNYVGLQLRYGTGRGTVTAVNPDLKSVTVDITTPFPDTTVHTLYPGWRVGPAAFLDSTPYLVPDSAMFEHLSIVGVNSGYTFSTYLSSNGPLNNPGVDLQPPVATHMVWRNNIQFAGAVPGDGTGFVGESNKYGKVAADFYCDPTTRDMRKNVLFGPLVLNPAFAGGYTGDMEGGAGSGHVWGMHDPDHLGATGGGAVGFTDYVNGDYRLTPGSQYHNWATDGTDPGCDIVTLNAKLVGVASPDVP